MDEPTTKGKKPGKAAVSQVVSDYVDRLSDEHRMLVVLKQEALETATPLIEFHHRTGIRCEIWLADDIEDPQEIKDRVSDMFEDGLEYLFIIGDGYEDDWDVPMFYWDPVDPGRPVQDVDSYSDTWFVCLDPPDDEGFDDHYMELSVGRLVYEGDNFDELSIQVEKLLDYLQWSFPDPDDGDWLERALLIASSDRVEGERVYLACKQEIEGREYRLPAPDLLTAYGNVQGVTNQTVLDFINDDGVGIVNYRGHGSSSAQLSWNLRNQSITRGTVDRMDNRNRPFVLISSACYNANIATFGNNGNSDCILESYQKRNGGSVCAHGSVISTFTDANSFFDRRIFSAWFDDGLFELGGSMVAGAADMVTEFDQTRWPTQGRTNLRAYVWLGDPALEIRTEQPHRIDVAVEDTIPVRTQRLTATITADGEALPGARFCLRTEDDEVYLVGRSNAEGVVTIEIDPPIEEAAILHWGVYERNGIPRFGEILAADDFGMITGRVTDFSHERPIAGATVQLSRFEVSAETDDDGRYRIAGVPSGEYTLTVRAEGFLPASRDVAVNQNEPLVADFELRFAELVIDSAQVNVHLDVDQQEERRLVLGNAGDGPLTWSARLDFGDEMEPFELIRSYDAALETADDRLNGAVFTGGLFYIAGGNHNADPNFIYVLDTTGREVGRFRLPDYIAGIGIHDLAWDGRYIYGSSDREIVKIDLDGEVVEHFEGPYNPNVALAVDDGGDLWVCNNRNALVHIDADGNRLGSIPNDYPVRALAWFPEAPDGYRLLMFVRGDDERPVTLYRVDVETGEIRFAADLTTAGGEIPGDGLFVTAEFTPTCWTLVGMVNEGPLRHLRLWHLDYRTSWMTFEPSRGRIEPDGSEEMRLVFDSHGYADGLELCAILLIENDGVDPSVEIPVRLRIGEVGVLERPRKPLPRAFTVGAPFPNPFNSTTFVPVELPAAVELKIKLFDLNGRMVDLLAKGRFPAGRNYIPVRGGSIPAGVYLVVVEWGERTAVSKIALVK